MEQTADIAAAAGAVPDPRFWNRTLFEALREGVRRSPQAALEDQERTILPGRRLLLAAAVLGRKLAKSLAPGERVGVLLPNVNAVAVALFGLSAFGRVPAMLNYTAGPGAAEAACAAVGIRTILTSRRFIEVARLEETAARLSAIATLVYLEDVRAGLTLADRLAGAALARLPFLLRPRARPDDVALVLFTSGTERQPKAVALTHANILANIEQVEKVFWFTTADRMFNPLPVFHAFGLIDGLILPLVLGFRSFIFPSPLRYDEIPKLVAEDRSTILLGVDTFAANWARHADDGDFASVRLCVLGAERVKEATRATWQERFGITVLEGYGVTEAAPVVAVNTPERHRPGTVGPLLPLIETRLEPVPGIVHGARLHIRGPNVMAGYFAGDGTGRVVPLPDGWHDTGDIVAIEDGFVAIVSRAKRFAKIAGEMVSLTAVESYVTLAWPEHSHAVVAVPDARRGEALVVMTSAAGMDRASLLAAARQVGMREITVPDRFMVVDTLPLLGTGKTDYVTIEKLARQRYPA